MKYYFQLFVAVVCMTIVFAGCREEDDFGESIYDTNVPAVDPTSATAPFDQWLYDNFVAPYNTQIEYRLNLLADLGYQLTPADYKKSQLLAHLIKYLFFDVYNMYGEKDAQGNDVFMKKYGPRLIHFIGSKEFSPSTGTETLGYASGGVKITLNNVNGMKWEDENLSYDVNDIIELNKAQFHVFHHEFSHILHQTKLVPVDYGQITATGYDAMTWQKNDSTKAHSLGFVTHYAMSGPNEDFVEVLSCTITDNDDTWMARIWDACLNGGVKAGDKARVYQLIHDLGISDEVLDDPNKMWNKYSIYEESIVDETGSTSKRFVLGHLRGEAMRMYEENDITPTYTFVKQPTSFRDYLENWVTIDETSQVKGMNAILTKFDKATRWYTEKFGLELFALRAEVRHRQEHINEFIKTIEFYDL